jgi:hypothetical protein
MPREIVIPSPAYEDIQFFQEFPGVMVEVRVGLTDAAGVFYPNQNYMVYQISGEMYAELNSANPSWNPSKPEGTFFNNDLWHFIDLIRG